MIIDVASDLHIDYNISCGIAIEYFKSLFKDDLKGQGSVLILT